MNPYLKALEAIPRGQTRSFLELAALAGRPGAARAAGRAVSSAATSELPWHRVVSKNKRPTAEQLARLRREGARPKPRESVPEWARRTGARFIGFYGTLHFASPTDERIHAWNPEQLEPFVDEATALSRGFVPIGNESSPIVPLPEKRCVETTPGVSPLRERLRRIDWETCRRGLGSEGLFYVPRLLTPSECASLLNRSTRPERFERTIHMLPKGYGVGNYHYYSEPLPKPARALREHLYRELAPDGFPRKLESFWDLCRNAGQTRASSILICYGKGGVNHPHRDVYGRVSFPFQALIVLSRRGRDFAGGEFYLADENGSRPPTLVPASEGDLVIFATRDRKDGKQRIPVRHGMTLLERGRRYGLGIVFHLAE